MRLPETYSFKIITIQFKATYVLTVSHQKSRIFFPPTPGSNAFGTPARCVYKPVTSYCHKNENGEQDHKLPLD